MMPSMTFQPVTRQRMVESRTAPVVSTSLRLSAAVASSVSEAMRWPTVRLRRLIQSLTAMETASTPRLSQLKTTGVGCRTLPMDSLPSERPMARMVTLTTSPARYS